MPTPRLQPESWKQALAFINKCPVCSALYDTDKAELFANHDRAYLVHLTCESCRGYFVVVIINLGHGLSSVGIVTDLSLTDAKRLHGTEPITLDEALEAHAVVQSSEFHSSFC